MVMRAAVRNGDHVPQRRAISALVRSGVPLVRPSFSSLATPLEFAGSTTHEVCEAADCVTPLCVRAQTRPATLDAMTVTPSTVTPVELRSEKYAPKLGVAAPGTPT